MPVHTYLHAPPLPHTHTHTHTHTQAVAPVLDNPNEPVNDLSYFDCLDLVMEKSKVLSEAGALCTAHAKKGAHEKFGLVIENTAAAICQITEVGAWVCIYMCEGVKLVTLKMC